uniref:carbohydrate-binding protein n=1 Tax=Pontiella sp. TaxID=2837462 RepID=UPI003563C924
MRKFMKTGLVLALAVFGSMAYADTWTGLGDGTSYEDALNWDPSTNAFTGSTRDINGPYTVTRAVDVSVNRTFVQGGATLNVTAGSHSDGQAGNNIRNFVGNGSQGTVNVSGASTVYDIGHVFAIAHSSNSDGTVNLSGGTLKVGRGGNTLVGGYGGIFTRGHSVSIGGNISNTGVTGLMEITGGTLTTRTGLVVAKNGTLSIVGSDATILLGGANDDTGWFGLSADGLLKASVDAGGVSKIFVEEADNANTLIPTAELQPGSLLYVTNTTAYGGSWTLLEVENGDITNNGLAFAAGVDTNVWSFTVDNSDANGKLIITAAGDPVPVTPRELVGYWPFDGNANDAVSNYNGTVSGTANWVDGIYGSALEFNGTDTSVAVGNALESVSNELTVAFWCYGDPSLPNEMNAFSGGAGRELNCHFPWSGGGTYGRVYFDAHSPDLSRDRLTSDVNTTNTLWGGWNHWIFTKNVTNGTMTMYVNGDELTSGTGKTNHMDGIDSLYIGSDRGTAAFYQGLLDEFRVYNYEISADEIFQISRPTWHVEAEDFDAGSGYKFEDTQDVGGGQNLGWIAAGEWMEYTIDVQTPGLHRIDFRVGSNGGGDGIAVLSGGSTIGTLAVSDTGGWQTWETQSLYVEFTSVGTQTLRLEFLSGGFNLNWFSYEPAEDPVSVIVGTVRNQMMRYGLDYERLWYWYGSGLDPVPDWSVNDCNIDYIRTAVNAEYELDEATNSATVGNYDLSAYTQKIIPMMTAMQEANPNIKWFASPRPLNEAVSSATWQPYPIWVTGASSYTAGDYDFNDIKCAQYLIRYLRLMKHYGFKISYIDLTNEWQSNVAGGKITQSDARDLVEYMKNYMADPASYQADVDPTGFYAANYPELEPADMPLTIAPSSWNYSQGASWISYLNTDAKKDAIDIAASHNTDKTGTAQDFADQVRTTLGADTEIWETEQHGWKGNSSTSEAMSFSYMIETVRAGFTGLSGWLAIGTTSQGHCYLLNNGSTVKRNVKYYMFKKLSNTSNYGYALDIDQTDDLTSTMALIRDNLLTIWVINTSSSAVLAEFDISGHLWDGSEITWTRWDEDLSINADETPEGIEGTVLEADASSVTAVLEGRAAYCIEIPLVDYEDNFPFVQAENYDALTGAVDQGSYVAYSAGGSESAYNLDIVKTYPHDVAFRVSSESADIAFDVYDGTNLLTTVSRIATGGAGNWTTLYKTLHLDGGPMELRIVAQNGGWNLDWIKFDQQYYSATESTLDNLALGLSTNAYSAGSVHRAGYEADKAIDGDTGTRWA